MHTNRAHGTYTCEERRGTSDSRRTDTTRRRATVLPWALYILMQKKRCNIFPLIYSRRLTLESNLIDCFNMDLLCEKMYLGLNLIVSSMAIVIMCNVTLFLSSSSSSSSSCFDVYWLARIFHELLIMKISQRGIETSVSPESRLADKHNSFPLYSTEKNERAMSQVE